MHRSKRPARRCGTGVTSHLCVWHAPHIPAGVPSEVPPLGTCIRAALRVDAVISTRLKKCIEHQNAHVVTRASCSCNRVENALGVASDTLGLNPDSESLSAGRLG